MPDGSGRPVVLAALRQELTPLRRAIPTPMATFVRTGVGPERAEAVTRRECAHASLVVSTGCCGGLVPGASAGMLAIPDRVLSVEGDVVTEAPAPTADLRSLARSVAERLGFHCSARPLATVTRPLLSPESKRRCHHLCGAVVVDMETAAIARAANDLGVPYLSIRVVLDRSDESLPDLPGPDDSGKLQLLRPLLNAGRRPRSILTMASLTLRLRSVGADLARCVAAVLEEMG